MNKEILSESERNTSSFKTEFLGRSPLPLGVASESKPIPGDDFPKRNESKENKMLTPEVLILIPCGGSSGPDKIINHLLLLESICRELESKEKINPMVVIVANIASFSSDTKAKLEGEVSSLSWVELRQVKARGFGETLKQGLEDLAKRFPKDTIVIFEDDGISLGDYMPFIHQVKEKGFDVVLKARFWTSRFSQQRGPFRWLFSFLDIAANCTLGLPPEVHFGAGRLGCLVNAFSKTKTVGWATEKEAFLRAKKQGLVTSQVEFFWKDDPRSAAGGFQALSSAASDYFKIFWYNLCSKYSGK